MEAHENAKEEIEGENTVFQDIAEWWDSVLSFRRSKDAVTKYDLAADETMFYGMVSCLLSTACMVVFAITAAALRVVSTVT